MDDFSDVFGAEPATKEQPTTEMPSKPDDFSDVFGDQKQSRVNVALQAGSENSPAKSAQVLDLQNKTGLPWHLVEGQEKELDQHVKSSATDPDALMASHPGVADFVSQSPHHASLFQLDPDNAKAHENAVQDYDVTNALADGLKTGMSLFTSLILNTPAGFAQLLQLPQNLLSENERRMNPDIPDAMRQFDYATLPAEATHSIAQQINSEFQKSILNKDAGRLFEHLKDGDAAGAGRSLASFVATQIPLMLGIVSNPLGPFGLGLGTAGQKYGEGIDAGVSPAMASINATAQGAGMSLATSRAFFPNLGSVEQDILKAAGPIMAKTVALNALKHIGVHVGSSALDFAGLNVAGKALEVGTGVNPDATNDLLSSTIESALEGAVNGAMGAGGIVTDSIGTIRDHAKYAQVKAESNKTFLTDIINASEKSPMRQMLQPAHAELLNKVVADSGVKTAYVPIHEFNKLFQTDDGSGAMDAAKKLFAGKEYEKAVEEGGDIKIPMGKFVDGVVSNPELKSLLDHVRTGDGKDDYTPVEAQQLAADVDAADKGSSADGASRVGELVRAATAKAGYKDVDADKYGALYEKFYRKLAKDFDTPGAGPRELLAKKALTIKRPGYKDVTINANSEDPKKELKARWDDMSPEEKVRLHYQDQNSGTLNGRAFEDATAPEGKGMVAHIEHAGGKWSNDNYGHEAGDSLFENTGQALLRDNLLTYKVGGGFSQHVASSADTEGLVAKANAELPEAMAMGDRTVNPKKFLITGVAGQDHREAGELHKEHKAKLEAAKIRTPRSIEPTDLDTKAEIKDRYKVIADIPQELRDKFTARTDDENFNKTHYDKATGLLNETGWHQLSHKAARVSMDVRGLAEINKHFGHDAGNELLREFGAELAKTAKEHPGMDVAHVSGDEFWAQYHDPVEMKKIILGIRDRLLQDNSSGQPDNSKPGEAKRPPIEFVAGIGGNDNDAEEALRAGKKSHTRVGSPEIRGDDLSGAQGGGKQVGIREDQRGVSSAFDNPSYDPEESPYKGVISDVHRLDAEAQQMKLALGSSKRPFHKFAEENGKLDYAKLKAGGNYSAYPDKITSPKLYGKNGNTEDGLLEKYIEEKMLPEDATLSDMQKKLNAEVLNKPPTKPRYSEEGNVKRGYYDQTSEEHVLGLLKKENPSTLLHESFHYFFHVRAEIADELASRDPSTLTENQQAFLDDHAQTLKEVGAKSFNEMTNEQHEKLAKWGEQYLMEGKAPTAEMQPLFDEFRSWLSGVYGTIKNIFRDKLPEMSPKMRGVMDRMLATHDEIAAAKSLQGPDLMPGIKDRKYKKIVQKARAAAEDMLTGKKIQEETRRQSKEWKDKRKEYYDQYLKEANQQPENVVLNALQKGVGPDGAKLDTHVKLDKSSVEEMLGKDAVKGLPKDVFAKGDEPAIGVDTFASSHGYESAADMVADISGRPGAEDLAAGRADAAMEIEHSDIQTGMTQQDALEAVHNEWRAKQLKYEWELMAKNEPNALKGMITDSAKHDPGKALKSAARMEIGALNIEDVKPEKYRASEEALRVKATEAAANGELEKSDNFKSEAEHNGELYKAANEAIAADGKGKLAALKEQWKQADDDSKAQQAKDKAVERNNQSVMRELTRKIAKRMPSEKATASAAAYIVSAKPVGDISASGYLRTENSQRNLAAKLFTGGDIEGALNAKKTEMLNHELWRSATDAQKQMVKIKKYMKDFNKIATSKRVGKAGESFIKSIDYIRGQHGFGDPVEDGKAHLDKLMEKQMEEGNPLSLANSVLSATQVRQTRDIPYQDVLNAFGAVRQIDHMASEKNKLTVEGRNEEFQVFRDKLHESVVDIHGEGHGVDQGYNYDPHAEKTLSSIAGTGRRKFVAWMSRMSNIISEIDGHKANGPAFNHFTGMVRDAQIAEGVRMRAFRNFEKELFKDYSYKEKASMALPQINVEGFNRGAHSREEIMLALANMGNAENKDAYVKGNLAGHPEPEKLLEAMWSKLEPRDVDAVERMWKYADSHWDDVKKQEYDLKGDAPEKVENTAFDIKLADGSTRHLDGGYFPIMYDRARAKRADRAAMIDALKAEPPENWGPDRIHTENVKNVGQLFGGDFANWMTKNGHTKERQEASGQPVKPTFERFGSAMYSVIHDLSFRQPLINLHKTANDTAVKEDIIRAVGKEKWDEFNPVIADMAGQKFSSWADKVPQAIRSRLTAMFVGYNATTGLKHMGSELLTADELDAKWALKGIAAVASNKMFDSYNLMMRLDPLMKDRFDDGGAGDRDMHEFLRARGMIVDPGTLARTINNYLGKEAGSKAAMVKAMQQQVTMTYFAAVRYADKMTATMTWTGSYAKAIDGKVPGIEAGDEKAAVAHASRIVDATKGSSFSAWDQSAMLRGNEWQKLFTALMTQRNVNFNSAAKSFQQAGLNWAKGGLKAASGPVLAAMLYKVVAPGIWNQFVTHGIPETDDEKRRATEAVAGYPAEFFPMAPEAVRYATSKWEHRHNPELTIGALELGKNILDTPGAIYDFGWGNGLTKDGKMALENTAGAWMGFPVPRIFHMVELLEKWQGK